MAEEEKKPPLEVYWDDVRVARHRSEPEVTVPKFRDIAEPEDLVIGTNRERVLAIIKPNGDLLFGPGYTPNEAAQVFWEHMAHYRLVMEERFLTVQHMEAILTRLGRADMECERLRTLAASETDPISKEQRSQSAELAVHSLEMIAHQAIELGRALVSRPEIPLPDMPAQVPDSIRENPNTEYQGQEGLPGDALADMSLGARPPRLKN